MHIDTYWSRRMSMEVEGRRREREEQRRIQTIITVGQRQIFDEPEACSCNADSNSRLTVMQQRRIQAMLGVGQIHFLGRNRGVSR